jgi:hypothetical protein
MALDQDKGDYLLLVVPQQRLIVTSSDKRRIIQPTSLLITAYWMREFILSRSHSPEETWPQK